jgi:hypothetical protein
MSMPINDKQQRSDSVPARGLMPALALLLFSMTFLAMILIKVLWV